MNKSTRLLSVIAVITLISSCVNVGQIDLKNNTVEVQVYGYDN